MEKDVFDYIDEEDETKPPDRSGMVWNILTILVLLTTVCVGILFVTVLINPSAGFNPFPPPPVPERMELATPTSTPKSILPPTWTPVSSSTPTQARTQSPENTPLPTEEGQVGDGDQGGDQEILGDMPVVLHEGSPQYIPATSFHPDLGCNWMGVAGQVIDINGAPVQGWEEYW
jgi:hypothetical protein